MVYEQIKDLTDNNTALLIYFFSPGCAACADLQPKVDMMIHKNFKKIKYHAVDVSDNPSLAAEAGVFSAPSILIFFEGKEYIRESKYISVDQLKNKISRYYDMIFT